MIGFYPNNEVLSFFHCKHTEKILYLQLKKQNQLPINTSESNKIENIN